MVRFALRLVRPYSRWLAIVVGAMLLNTVMGLASPWPLKIVLDSVFAGKPMPAAFAWLVGADGGRAAQLNVAVVSTIVIALLQAASAAVGMERVRAVLDADERLPRAPNARAIGRVDGRVEFRQVTFGYDPARPVLTDLSFTIEPGQLVGLVGPSGSGKSTLVSLIPRFYDPSSGVVAIDGHDVREFTIRSLRRQIGFVLQDTQLFYAPIWQNIAYGQPEATREAIVRAATLAQAHAFIEALPAGYDTVVGQGGLPLSGGQRQRLGIARAMVRDAAILILDEPSSGLDAELERLVFEGLDRLLAGKTTFVIAHRLSTIRRADLILVLDRGRIVEHGSHDELLARDGLYASLQRLQPSDDPGAAESLAPAPPSA